MSVATVALMRHGGSHLIRPIVADMGFHIIEPGAFGAPLDEARGPVIVWRRDPRNRMAATYRWWMARPKKRPILSRAGDTPDEQLAWLLTDGGFMIEMLKWAWIWCRWPAQLSVKFEDMITGGAAEIRRIAAHLGAECDADKLFRKHHGTSKTYNPDHSDWRVVFGPKSLAAWQNNDGDALMKLMGYDA